MSVEAADAQAAIERLGRHRFCRRIASSASLARAERSFAARRWAQALAVAPLARVATGDDQELIALRLAECDYYLNRFRASRDALQAVLDGRVEESRSSLLHLAATRGLGLHDAYVELSRSLVNDYPETSWAEDTLNNLASHYVTLDGDEQADAVFRELASFSRSRYAERAAWKIGWWA